MPKLSEIGYCGEREVHDDLTHSSWKAEPPRSYLIASPAAKRPKCSTPLPGATSGIQAAHVVPVLPLEVAKPLPAGKMPCDLVQPPEGPLFVVYRNKPDKHRHRMHFFTTNGSGIGCGWAPTRDRISSLPMEDYMRGPDEYMECGPCFSAHTFPSSWNDPGSIQITADASSDSDDSVSGGSDSASDDNTASEAEAIPLSDLIYKGARITEAS